MAMINRKYFISPSTLSKLKNLSSSEFDKVPHRKIEQMQENQMKLIKEIIMKYYMKIETEFVAADVQKHLFENYDIIWYLKTTIKIMKHDLNLTFKRWISRPNSIDFNKTAALRWMFAIKFTKKLKSSQLICNIDEWTISRNTKCNYFWSTKGVNKETKNSPFYNSTYLILAILSNGYWHWFETSKIIDSSIFCHFFQKLNFWIVKNNMFGHDEVLWIMDNCPSHKSKTTYSVLNKSNFQINFIRIYSPDLAPVELGFAFIKKKYIQLWRSLKVNLNKKQSKNELLRVLKMLTPKLVKGFYSKFFETLKEYLNLFT